MLRKSIKIPQSVKNAFAYRPFQYALLVAGVLLAVYFIGKKAGKGVAVSYPNSKTADPVTDTFTKQALNLVDALFQAFDGLSEDWLKKTVAVEKILNLTDNQLVYIFNLYNQTYLPGKKETLYTDIEGEWFGVIGRGSDTKRDILKRMRELGMNK